jgi:hypothetical protein
MVKWQGEKGQFISIVTNDETCFLEKKSDKKYIIHNLLDHNPMLRPGIKREISVKKSRAAHTNWAIITVENLLTKGIKIEDCSWLNYVENGSFSYIRVEYDLLPDHIEIGKETFFKNSGFRETNLNSDPKKQADRRRLIRKHTKKCKKCGDLFISSLSDKCIDCR